MQPASARRPSSRQRSRARPFTVGEVLGQVRACLETGFRPLLVRGEVRDCRSPRSGHLYFSLRDRGARLRVVVFSSTLQRVPHTIKDGEEVLVWGQITAYPASGDVQLVAEHFEPEGLGRQWAKREALRQALSAEGVFARERKRPLPRFPRAVGVVTSPTGSAIHDVLSTLARRYPGAKVVLAPVGVNGAASGPAIAEAIRELDRRGEVDVMLVVRGGGSAEDLAGFDQESVVRAIVNARTPTVSGVGHEDDVTLAGLAADRRAPTPTAAAELAVPARDELLAELDTRAARLRAAMRDRLLEGHQRVERAARSHAMRAPILRVQELRQRLRAAGQRLELLAPRARLARRREQLGEIERRLGLALAARVEKDGERLDAIERRLGLAVRGRLEHAERALAAQAGRLDSLSPLRVLARGFSLTTREDGGLVQRAADVQVGDVLHTRLAEGALRTQVLAIEPPSESPAE